MALWVHVSTEVGPSMEQVPHEPASVLVTGAMVAPVVSQELVGVVQATTIRVFRYDLVAVSTVAAELSAFPLQFSLQPPPHPVSVWEALLCRVFQR